MKNKLYRSVSVDDFLRDPILNEKRIKAYRDIAKDYTVQESTVRDIFMLGINFAIANMEKVEVPSEDDIEDHLLNHRVENRSSVKSGASFILNHIKGNNHDAR